VNCYLVEIAMSGGKQYADFGRWSGSLFQHSCQLAREFRIRGTREFPDTAVCKKGTPFSCPRSRRVSYARASVRSAQGRQVWWNWQTPSEELSAEAWRARGIKAYQEQRFDKAAEYFGKAVAIDPESADAHLAVGATRLTLYKRGRWMPPPYSFSSVGSDPEIADAEWRAYEEQERALIIEQNSTNWPLAEKSLKRASQLDPQNKLVIEYLCALYWMWEDPVNEENDRVDEAKEWLKRLADVDPTNKYADLHCGILLSIKARKLLPDYGGLASLPDHERASLRTKVGPLLEEARHHLTRALGRLTLDQEHAAVSHFMDDITSMQTYLIDPEQAAREMRDKAMELFRKHSQSRVDEREAGGQPSPSGTSGTITFTLLPRLLPKTWHGRFRPTHGEFQTDSGPGVRFLPSPRDCASPAR
jgi:tetratricopeptide (TPR) repeat protein